MFLNNNSVKGYVSKKEVLRLKATLFALENEKLGFSTNLQSNLADFNVLLQTSNTFYLPMPDRLDEEHQTGFFVESSGFTRHSSAKSLRLYDGTI